MARIFLLFALLATKTIVSKGWARIDIDSDCTIIIENDTIQCLKDKKSINNQEKVFHNNEISEIDGRILFPNDENSEENRFPEEDQKIEISEEDLKDFSIKDRFNHIPIKGYDNSNKNMSYSLHNGKLPDRFDWREQWKVTPARDQKHCNACWAFSMTATIESHMMIYRGAKKNLDLSEQMLIDCLEDSPGCNSGSIVQSYSKLVSQIGSMVPEKEYPYADGQQQCHKYKYNPKLSIAGFKRILPNEEEMKWHLVQYGPLTAAINSKSMKNYDEVVIDEPTYDQCPSNDLNHAVEIVGYDYYRDDETEDKSKQYWIIKNSWGTKFGENGYYYLVLGRNACGIAEDVTVPLVN